MLRVEAISVWTTRMLIRNTDGLRVIPLLSLGDLISKHVAHVLKSPGAERIGLLIGPDERTAVLLAAHTVGATKRSTAFITAICPWNADSHRSLRLATRWLSVMRGGRLTRPIVEVTALIVSMRTRKTAHGCAPLI
jgi:hypothetical protein